MGFWRGKRNGTKYGAERVELPSGESFPSKLEAAVYEILRLRERAGEISEIKRQDSVSLGFGLRWKVDFSFTVNATGARQWAEAKGVWDRQAKRNLKMWDAGAGPGPLEIWQGSYRAPKLVETVTPTATLCPHCGR